MTLVPLVVLSGLLILAGALKLARPYAAVDALNAVSLPGGALIVRLLAGLEVVVGASALTLPGRWAAALLGAAFLGLAAATLRLARERSVAVDHASGCGCFGAAGPPVHLIHVTFNLAGAALLLGYGTVLNLAPLEFGQVVGLYIAVLFVVWQIINFVVFRSLPTMPILLGGALVIAGGMIVTFWKPA